MYRTLSSHQATCQVMFKQLIVFLILCGGVLGASLWIPSVYLLPDINRLIFFFAIATFLACFLALWGLQKEGNEGVLVIMAAFVIKLLACLVFVLVYLHKNQVDKILFVSNFFVLYILFTLFEMYSLLANLRHQKNKIETSNK